MIALYGCAGDAPLDAIRCELEIAGYRYWFLEQTRIESVTLNEQTLAVRVDGNDRALDAVSSAYVRPYDTTALPFWDSASQNARLDAIKTASQLEEWADICNATVVNRPSAAASNASKLHQLHALKDAGFEVPSTLVTTCVEALRAFHATHGRIIFKSLSSVRSIVTQLDVRELERRAGLDTCPVQFQEYIDGRDVRVHVIGDDCFACEIASNAVDYRYASGVVVVPMTLPADIADRCLRLAKTLKFHVAGIDLRRTKDDIWYCFEINPSPAFTYYAHQTQQPIAKTIAAFLARASRD